mmetsp:Transcript_94163/g.282309  ORF Transcript_94163/g.282309 Transcript_94163/m.282309 type:complete len:221 (+) Transcript_94163:43-705(+)|eukprot:6014502-Prymnesium_polylepis.1
MGSVEDAFHHETDGYGSFVKAHAEELEEYAELANDDESHTFLKAHLHFVEESAHVGCWFQTRHVEMQMRGESQRQRKEARQWALWNMVCDAANADFCRRHGAGTLAAGSEDMRQSAQAGITMAFGVLSSRPPPPRFEQDFDRNIQGWVFRIVRLTVEKRKRAKEAAAHAKQRAAAEQEAEIAAVAAAEKAVRQKGPPIRLLLLLGLLVMAAAVGIGSRSL